MKPLNANNSDKEDQKLVRKTQKGHQQAFEKLVKKYQKVLYYSVRKMMIDHDSTDDIVQEAFVKAYINLHQFDISCPFYPWLYRIAINTALNHQTKTKLKRSTFVNENDESINTISPENDEPLNQVLQSELELHYENAIEKLPFEQRIIFIMRTNEGLSYQEISEHLEISVGTVMSRLSRARTRLKTLLQPYLQNEVFKE